MRDSHEINERDSHERRNAPDAVALQGGDEVWNEMTGAVTRAYDEWRLARRELEAFLKNGLRFAELGYQQVWNRLARRPAGDDPPEVPDEFDKAVDGLLPGEFEQLLLSAVLRDVVSAFELYLERAAEEVLGRHRLTFVRRDPQNSPGWREVSEFYSQYLGVRVSTDSVRMIRGLRHILTHQRGELRSEKVRSEFAGDGEFPALSLELSLEDVLGYIDTLGEVIRSADRLAYEYSWGGKRLTCILAGELQPK